MRIVLILAALFCAALPMAASAQPTPSRAPVPAWVTQIAIPDADPERRDRASQTLLVSQQVNYAQDQHDHYTEFAILAQNAQGVQSAGNIVLPWQPDQSELIVHKVQIRRGSEVTDLLANGRDFTVLRRENNLESAMLDGVLTAVMQAEGLTAGDTLVVAFTVRRRGGTLPLRGESALFVPPDGEARRFFVRQIWPSGASLRWRGTGLFERARVRTTAAGSELVLDLTDVQGIAPPAGAPPRFLLPPTLQVSQYRDWNEISTILAPHYERAATLAPDSPLRAEIERIAAQSSDQRSRSMTALRLVQDQVRYLALMMGEGNYLPAGADESWSRRYGDCKAKTVVLLALLRGLGIEAEPVLVNVAAGDSLRDLLPQMSAFDHVIVRARIDDRSYWLDGTRSGDRQIDDLASSNLGWGLPLRSAGAALEAMPFQPANLPAFETRITYDGSRGLLGSVPASGEVVFRGELAAVLRIAQAQGQAEAFDQMRRQVVTQLGVNETADISDSYDDTQGTFVIRFSGTRELEWSGTTSSRNIAYQFDNTTLDWTPDFERAEGPGRDAPFSMKGLGHYVMTETVILPGDGEGFSVSGGNIDRTIAGIHFSRTLTLADGRATARTSFRPLQLEISAEAARSSVAALQGIRESNARVTGPAAALTRSDRRALREREPTTAEEFVDRGYNSLQSGNLDSAATDFERAAALAPQWSRPLSNQAILQLRRGNVEEAEALLARAEALNARDFVIPQARGLIQMRRNRPIQAVAAFTESLALDPGNRFTLLQRASAYQRLGEHEDALADIETVLSDRPNDVDALLAKARIHVWRDEHEQAATIADKVIEADPNNPLLLSRRAHILRGIGRNAEAVRALEAALDVVDGRISETPADNVPAGILGVRAELLADMGRVDQAIEAIDAGLAQDRDNADFLNARCWTLATANVQLERALADCERAVAAEPRSPAILDSRAFVNLRLGRLDAAIADANAAIEINPHFPQALYVRGLALLRRGDREAGERDLAAARRLMFDIDAEYRGYGVAPPAAGPAPQTSVASN
ncbi:MAG: tetratricopeptide repeat protein [Allosphingosinicella sp.]